MRAAEGLERIRNRRTWLVGGLGLVIVLTLVSIYVLGGSGPDSIDAGQVEETSSVSELVATGPTEPEKLSDGVLCGPADSSDALDIGFEQFVAAYNNYDVASVLHTIGQGAVVDPSLELGQSNPYPSVEAWVAAAEVAGDRIEVLGYGAGSPFRLFATRTNEQLMAVGVDGLSLTFEISASSSCGERLRTLDEISAPDACIYRRLVDPDDASTGCSDPLEPRMGHVSAWTGDELVIFGGASGTTDGPGLKTGLGYSPESGWRDLAPAPIGVRSWPTSFAGWADDRMIVVGASSDGVIILSYFPADDRWEVSPPLPEDRYGTGAVAFTGTEVVLVGGSQNDPRDTAWSYQLDAREWRSLPEPGIRPIQGMAGVWTGVEAIFFGGYPSSTSSPGVAYNPSTGTWRPLPPAPTAQQLQGHELIWTGEEVIAVGGHTGPSHSIQLVIYDPSANSWRESAPLPIPAVEDLEVDWTGTELLLWGGYGSYNNGVSAAGARYNPSQDSWRVTAPSPLSARCSHSATMTPFGFVVTGGLEICGDPGVLARGDAAVYDPQSDTWTKLGR